MPFLSSPSCHFYKPAIPSTSWRTPAGLMLRFILSLPLLLAGLDTKTFAESTPAESSVAPGGGSVVDQDNVDLENKAKHHEWTLEGPIGPTPERRNDKFPLSDPGNKHQWSRWEELSDEFNSSKLDASKWTPRHRTWRGRKPAPFMPSNVAIKDGLLGLTMRKEAPPQRLKNHGFHTYTSAAVQSLTLAHFGYYEVRAKPMDSAGSSSFWFADSDNGWRTEIDVFELGGKGSGHEYHYNMNLHVFETPESKRHWNRGNKWVSPTRLADKFHVYGLDWSEKEIVYYFDGVPVRRVENTHWSQPLYMIFDTETMPEWFGLPDDNDLPSTYEIDYVRTWRRGSHE